MILLSFISLTSPLASCRCDGLPLLVDMRLVRGPLAFLLALSLALGATVPSLGAQQAQAAASSAGDTSALAALHAVIRRSNPELIARRAALDAVEARLRAAGFAPVSVLTVEAEDVPGGVDVTRAGSVRLAVEHGFLGGDLRTAARSLAASDVAAATADLYASERRVLARATQALMRAGGWSAIAQRLVEEDSLLSSAQSSLRVRFATGGARYVDVLRLRTERLRVETEQAAATTEARVAAEALRAFVGQPDSIPPSVAALLDTLVTAGLAPSPAVRLPPPPNVDSLLVASGATRLADAALAQARASEQLVLAGRRPRLTGFLGAQRFMGDNGRFILGPVFGGSISLPFTARQANTTAAVAAARAVTAAVAERTATLSSLRTDLLAAHARYEAARSRLAVYDAALLTGAREERESAVASYRSGTLTLIELLDFERALSRAEIDRLRSQIDAADALAALLAGASGPAARTQSTSSSTPGTANAP